MSTCRNGHDLAVVGTIRVGKTVKGTDKTRCRACARIVRQRYRKGHVEQERKRALRWKRKNRERWNAYCKQRNKVHPRKQNPLYKRTWRKKKTLPVHGFNCPKRIPWCDHGEKPKPETIARLDAAMKAVME